MKIGVMQPYFFPYLGYFDVINRVDLFVVFDTAQYVKETWMNRNRILHPEKGWQYVTVPVKKTTGAPIRDILLADKDAAHRRTLGMLEHYRVRKAPFYDAARSLVDRTFTMTKSGKLEELNVSCLRLVCEYLGVPFKYILLSEAGMRLPDVTYPGGWALEITAALGGTAYLNPPGGIKLFRPQDFKARGIELQFTELIDYTYAMGAEPFHPRLSIIDVLMWNAPQTVKAYLDSLAQRALQ